MQKYKIGIDEAGRGPWAGPVVAVSFCFNPENPPNKEFIKKLNDSKKLTEKKRQEVFDEIVKMSEISPLPNFPLVMGGTEKPQVFFGVGVVDNFLIDEINIKEANKEAMRRAIIEIQRKINFYSTGKEKKLEVFIDGNDNYNFEELERKPIFIVGGDGKIPEIGGASIIAKVFRDKLMETYSLLYPSLGLENHKGYGTKAHREYLTDTSKITNIHRLSYKPVKQVLEQKPKLLLHICCGPDTCVPVMDLKKDYEVICFWYDPNIQPKTEYEKRLEAFKKVCKIEKVAYIVGEYDVGNFFKKIKGLEHTPEKGEKCTKCYDMRLERTAFEARKLGIKYWSSTLNNSPHKDLEKMFRLGEKWSNTPPSLPLSRGGIGKENHSLVQGKQQTPLLAKEGLGEVGDTLPKLPSSNRGMMIHGADLKEKLEFLKIAFRKNKGFERSVEYTKKHNIYRQNYCGCIYSDTFPGGKEQFLEKLNNKK